MIPRALRSYRLLSVPSAPPDNNANSTSQKLPYALSLSFLTFLTSLSLALCILVSALCWISSTNHGLGTDNGSNITLFGWRFAPTFVAIIYAQLTMMMLYYIKITEPYTRMARSNGVSAKMSILHTTKPWWSTLVEGFSKKRNNGKISTVLISACAAYIIAALLIPPLSSLILLSYNVPISTNFEIERVATPGTAITLKGTPEVLMRTKGHLAFNLSVGPWSQDKYTIFPFWPSTESEERPFGASSSLTPRSFKAVTTVVSAEYVCQSMTYEETLDLRGFSAEDIIDPNHDVFLNDAARNDIFTNGSEVQKISSKFSTDGCNIQFDRISRSFWPLRFGRVIWSPFSRLNADKLEALKYNTSAGCEGKDIILITSMKDGIFREPVSDEEVLRQHANLPHRAWSCSSEFATADVPVMLTMSVGKSENVSFDIAFFNKQRKQIPISMLDTEQARSAFFDARWDSWSDQSPYAYDPSATLFAEPYSQNFTQIIGDDDLNRNVERILPQFFSQSLLSSYLMHRNTTKLITKGRLDYLEKRVVVVLSIAVPVAVLLALNTGFIAFVCLMSRLGKRPLPLMYDPFTTISALTMITKSQLDTKLWHSISDSSAGMKAVLRTKTYSTSQLKLIETSNSASDLKVSLEKGQNSSSGGSNWHPGVFRGLSTIGLATLLICFLATVVVLDSFAKRNRLLQSTFVQELDMSWLTISPWRFTPFSVIPTLVSIVIGSWWMAFQQSMCTLQPFIAMARVDDSRSSGGLKLYYCPANLLSTCAKSVRKHHWLLALISIGSLLCQLLAISSSALFERRTFNVTSPVVLNRTREPRQAPLYVDHDTLQSGVAAKYFSAVNQMMHRGPDPPWSLDGWSFAPIDLSGANFGSTSKRTSLTTVAMRARAECSTGEEGFSYENTSDWLYTVNFTDSYLLNQSMIPGDIDHGYTLTTKASLRGPSGRAYSCPLTRAQITGGGQWHSTRGRDGESITTDQFTCSTNFTASWLYGPARSGFMTNTLADSVMEEADTELLSLVAYKQYCLGGDFLSEDPVEISLFTEIPFFQVVECVPLIEESPAWITVNPNGQVLSFEILESPQQTETPWKNIVNYTVSTTKNGTIYAGGGYAEYGTGYGIHFLRTMLDSPHIPTTRHDAESDLDMDALTHTMYVLADKDPEVLKNKDTFMGLVDRVFRTLFQHFISFNPKFSNDTDWAFQPIGTANERIIHPWNISADNVCITGGGPFEYPELNTSRTVEAIMEEEIEVLVLNQVAMWLTVAIIVCLLIITMIFAATKERYLSPLRRNVRCLADRMALLIGSERLLQWAREKEERGLDYDDEIVTRLGWFRTKTGDVRWGIELWEPHNPEGVEWIDDPYQDKEEKSNGRGRYSLL